MRGIRGDTERIEGTIEGTVEIDGSPRDIGRGSMHIVPEMV